MTYNPSLFAFNKLYGSARLGWTTVLGETHLGLAVDSRQPIPVSSVSIKDGYTIGEHGELSVDPATGTAQMSTHGAPTIATLRTGNAVEVAYNSVVLFAGSVTAVTADVEAGPVRGYFTQQNNYTLASRESILLATVEAWTSLPQETALARLGRWFTVDTTAVSAVHRSFLDTLVAAEAEAGSATKLDLARAFSAATGLPVRIRAYISGYLTSVAVLDPMQTPATIAAADAWAHSVSYQTHDGSPALIPTSVSVRTDDTTLMGGSTGSAEVGFLAGDTVDVFGYVVPVARIDQTFGKHYSASLELEPTGASPSPAPETTTTAPTTTVGSTEISVTAYGAVPNGVTDSAAGINAAINASPPGSAIVFPGGTYRIEAPVLLRANRAYIANGDVVLMQKPNTVMECLVKVNPEEPIPRRGIHWQGIGLNGQAMNQFYDPGQPESAGNPLQLNNTVYRADSGFESNNGMILAAVQFSNFYDLSIRNMGGTGLILRGLDAIAGQSGEDDFNQTTSTLHFTSPYIYACGKYGVFFGDRTDDNHIEFGDIGACQFECVYMIAGSSSLRDTTIWGSKQANGILIGAPTNQIIGCQIEGHAQHGIQIGDYGAYNFIASNKLYYNSTQAAGGYDGINITGISTTNPPKYNTIIGNFIYAGIGEFFPTPADWVGMRHGIALEGTCIHTVVNGNNVDLAPAGAQPNTGAPGIYGLKAGDTFNGLRYTDAAEDAARLAANPRGLVDGAPWWRDDIGLTCVYSGPSRDRIERMLMSKYDIDSGAFWVNEGVTSMAVGVTWVRYDNNYTAIASPGWNTTWWIVERYADQFTVAFGTSPGAGGARCDWTILRQGD